MSYGPEYDDYAESGNEGRVSDDYTPKYTDTEDGIVSDILSLLHTNPWD